MGDSKTIDGVSRELLTRLLFNPDDGDYVGETWISLKDQLREHLAKPVDGAPPGWKLVPIQPTPEMLKAVDDEADDKHLARGRAISAWGLMLDAAPSAPKPEPTYAIPCRKFPHAAAEAVPACRSDCPCEQVSTVSP